MKSSDWAGISTKFAADILLNDVETASLLGVSTKTARNWRALGKGPRFVRIGERAIRYRPQDIRVFMDGACADLQPDRESSK